MTMEVTKSIAEITILAATGAFVNALFGVELQTLACAFVGAWIGAPFVRKLEAALDDDGAFSAHPTGPPSFSEKAWLLLRSMMSFITSAVASAIIATYMANALSADQSASGVVGLRNILALGVGILFYIILAKFLDDPLGLVAKFFARFLPSGGGKPP